LKVGYVSDTLIKKGEYNNLSYVQALVTEIEAYLKDNPVDVFILNGGITYDYYKTMWVLDRLSTSRVIDKDIKIRFNVGNTDFYIRENTPVDKVSSFMRCLGTFNNHPLFLPTHPILTQDVWIVGYMTWYDYTLYRGNPVSLKEVSRKKKGLFSKNEDNKYITDEMDYLNGTEKTFDVTYSKECVDAMVKSLQSYSKSFKDPIRKVICTYFYPNDLYIRQSKDYYYDTFSGSRNLTDRVKNFNITDWVVGKYSKFTNIRYEGINYKDSGLQKGYCRLFGDTNFRVLEVDYGDN
jgi:hypothetical protein